MPSETATEHRPGPFAGQQKPDLAEPGPIAAGERDARYDNEPPLEERIIMDFMEELRTPGEAGQLSIEGRINELMASAARVPEKIDDKVAGGIGDLAKQAREVGSRLDAAREKLNRPLLNAQRTLKGRADGLIEPLMAEVAKLRRRLDDWTREEARKRAEEERREAEARRIAEEARIRAEEAARAELEDQGLGDAIPADEPLFAPPPAPTPAPAAPMARGDYGSRVGTQKVWNFEILSIRQLPDRILKHPKVKEALEAVLRAEVRSGQRDIKGTRIWEDIKSTVR